MFPQKEIVEKDPPAEGCLIDAAAHHQFVTEYIKALAASGMIEENLAETIAEDAWRLKRSRCAEQKLIADAESEVDAFMLNGGQFRNFSIYEQRIQRLMERNLALLNKIRADSKAGHPEAFEQAKVLAQQNYLKDKPYDPSYDFPREKGFTFTTAEINASIRRDQRIREAKNNDRVAFDPAKSRDRYRLNIIDLLHPLDSLKPASFDPTVQCNPTLRYDSTTECQP